MTTETKAAPGYLFQMTCDFGNGKNMVVSGNWPVGVEIDTINADIDKFNKAFDRQRAIHEIPLLREKIEGTKLEIQSREEDLDLFLKTHPSPKGPIAQNVNKMKHEIVALKIALTRGEIVLAETELKVQ
jgi:hypothetical protein